MKSTAESLRLKQHHKRQANWKKWGPYLSERAWATVREDYSQEGDPWRFFPHDHARSRTYRWNEDGIGGICDRNQYICLAFAFWNGQDSILKERLFGLTGPEGNHGEDVKEEYFYLDNTPTHSYMKMLYKYPMQAFPYEQLVSENAKRTYSDPEYELLDTGVFDYNHYWDIFIEYAKAGQDDILIRIQVFNRSEKSSVFTLLPTLWFRNTWSWGYETSPMEDVLKKPQLKAGPTRGSYSSLEIDHSNEGKYYLYAQHCQHWLFTENETNQERLYGVSNSQPYVKDAFHRYIINQEKSAINPNRVGTKAAAFYSEQIPAHSSHTFHLRLSPKDLQTPFKSFEQTFDKRIEETEEFYHHLQNPRLNQEQKLIQRQAFAGLLWSKQLYYYDVEQWLKGDPIHPLPDNYRYTPRNRDWDHLVNFDILSMPDKWEYPWYASWDLAFHCLPFVLLDADFAKRQLELMTREWYMHPNGQLPAYEWNFSDVNPPVHAWATWRVFKIDQRLNGKADLDFLKGIFRKLLLNFTWWVNRKDQEGHNVFQGGFLGMDNISLFDRSTSEKYANRIDQSDGTAWMGFYCLIMMRIALELSKTDATYQDLATKFFEHFLRISTAMTQSIQGRKPLWDEEDHFFYDMIHFADGSSQYLKIRSIVGLLPLFAVEVLDSEIFDKMDVFQRRVDWFLSKRPFFSHGMSCLHEEGTKERRMMSLVNQEMLRHILSYVLDEEEFLSPYGIRSVSKYHATHPYVLELDGQAYSVDYQPGESNNGLFGGNSNWRGPIWFPINFLLIESLQKYHHYYGDSFKIECPTRSGNWMNLDDVAKELSQRLIRLFMQNQEGIRPIYKGLPIFKDDPNWQDLILFYECFHAEDGRGIGTSHQTGWTALIAKLLQQVE